MKVTTALGVLLRCGVLGKKMKTKQRPTWLTVSPCMEKSGCAHPPSASMHVDVNKLLLGIFLTHELNLVPDDKALLCMIPPQIFQYTDSVMFMHT